MLPKNEPLKNNDIFIIKFLNIIFSNIIKKINETIISIF